MSIHVGLSNESLVAHGAPARPVAHVHHCRMPSHFAFSPESERSF